MTVGCQLVCCSIGLRYFLCSSQVSEMNQWRLVKGTGNAVAHP